MKKIGLVGGTGPESIGKSYFPLETEQPSLYNIDTIREKLDR